MDKKLIEAVKKVFADNSKLQSVFIKDGKVEVNEAACAGSTYTIVGRHQIEAIEAELKSQQKEA
jgi:NACalpha-BTF3-like transcription factor